MTSLLPTLREYVRTHAENRPGVYRMLGPGAELLYVGKSVRVRTRLLSYFRTERGGKPWEMIRETARIEWEYVPNEFGALLREMRLIQRARPKYNVQHTRKRSYVFVKVTREPAPRILPVARVMPDGAAYFGPFPRVARVRETIRDLAHVMGLRDCPGTTPIVFDDQLEIFGAGSRAPRCLRAELGSCLAPCAGRTSSTEYSARVEAAVRFLEDRSREPLRRLETQMAAAVDRLDFEYAALLRDRLERLRMLQQEMAAWRGRVESLDFLYRVPGRRGADRLYFVRRGLVVGWTAHPKSRRARRAAAERARRAFAGAPWPAEALTPHQAAEILLVARWFRLHPEELERTTAPAVWVEENRASRTA